MGVCQRSSVEDPLYPFWTHTPTGVHYVHYRADIIISSNLWTVQGFSLPVNQRNGPLPLKGRETNGTRGRIDAFSDEECNDCGPVRCQNGETPLIHRPPIELRLRNFVARPSN